MATAVQEVLPPTLGPNSEPPPVFDGTTRLYIDYQCPYAQRVWLTRNYKGLKDKIQLIPIDVHDRPAWYKEKVYPADKVPALEHENKVIGESLDIVKYLDSHFEGPALLPDDPAKRQFAEEMISNIDNFVGMLGNSLKGDAIKEIGSAADYLEKALDKFDDGPFLVGQFSQADVAYVPFVERIHIVFKDMFGYDIKAGRPKLAAFIEELNKIDAYKPTKCDPKYLIEVFKSRSASQN